MYDQLKLDNQVCFRLYTASRLITQTYRPLLEPLGITYPQYLVLMVLWERGHQTVGDIAGRLLLESNTLTPLLQRMEKEGLVCRTKNAADARQTLVSLTRKGTELQHRAKDIPACMAAAWQGAPLGKAEVQGFVDMLDAIINQLKDNKKQNL